MAGAALGNCRDVRRGFCLGILGEISTAMAGRTTGQARVIHRGRRPGYITRLVASITLSGSRNMSGRLGQCIDEDKTTAMAGGTAPHRYRPSRSGMAHRRRTEGRVVVVAG